MLPKPAPFALTLPSDLKLLALARTFVETVCLTCHFDEIFCDAVKLATHEAVQNVIRHAHAEIRSAGRSFKLESYRSSRYMANCSGRLLRD